MAPSTPKKRRRWPTVNAFPSGINMQAAFIALSSPLRTRFSIGGPPAAWPAGLRRLARNGLRLHGLFSAVLVATALGLPARSPAQAAGVGDAPEIGIDEKLGEYVPEGVTLYNEAGEEIPLKSFLGKPALLALVYYRCPSICNPMLGNIADVLRNVDLEPGEDFLVIALSFDHTEEPSLAAQKKRNFLNTLPPDFPGDGWRFLTADSTSIQRLTKAVGFNFKKEGDLFIHSAALIALAPDGKIVRYLYGIDFLPFDFEMAVAEASKGKVGATISRVLAYCYTYDPEGRTYVFNITKVAGTLGLISVVALFIALTVRKKVKGRGSK